MNKVVKRIFNVIIDIVIILIMIISIIVVILSLSSKSSGIANIFGYCPLSVMSNSMHPTFNEGDLIIGHIAVDEYAEVEVGDVITFPIEVDGKTVLNTHRVVEIFKDNDTYYYKTKGDNNPQPDEDLQSIVTLRAKWTGAVIPGMGYFMSFLQSQLGFFVCILLPMILFFVYEAIRVIMNLMDYNKEKALEQAKSVVNSSELSEEQKQQAIAEYLAQQGIKEQPQNEEAPKQEEAKQEPTVQTPAEGSDAEADSQKK